MTPMDWTSAKMRVIFKDFEFGVTGGMPLFRILPEKITSGENGICHIDSARRVTVVFGLETLEQGFAVLLDKKGRLQNMPQEIFGNPGKLQLVPAEDTEMSGWFFPGASLAANTCYGMMPEAGHRLLLEFSITPAGPENAYMYREEKSVF
ncbi:MAG: hypothetical protein IKD46_09985 [Lentisphaeria bacterium]|nr:hypothetical protein [Lentisphaeria bacterium]